jgi:hypothetical protein
MEIIKIPLRIFHARGLRSGFYDCLGCKSNPAIARCNHDLVTLKIVFICYDR